VDRLGRNTIDILQTVEYFKANNFKLHIENLGMDTDSPFFDMMVSIMGTLAEQERKTIAERCKQGIEIAKSKGLYTGRKTGTTDSREKLLKKYSDIVLCLNKGMKVQDIANLTKKTRVTIYKVKALL
jgi:DNA invertase Pin-like site-specific DNA recombinase